MGVSGAWALVAKSGQPEAVCEVSSCHQRLRVWPPDRLHHHGGGGRLEGAHFKCGPLGPPPTYLLNHKWSGEPSEIIGRFYV